MGFFSKLFSVFTKTIGSGGGGIGGTAARLWGKVKQAVTGKPVKQPKTLPEAPTAPLPEVEERLYSARDAIRELREYQDQLTELMTSFDFDPEIVQAVSELNIEDIAEADFMRLNGALERMRRYLIAYMGGYIDSEDFDYGYFENELRQSIPEFGKKLQAVRDKNIFSIAQAGSKAGKLTGKKAAQIAVDLFSEGGGI